MDEYYRLLQSLPPEQRAPLEKLHIHSAPYVQERRLRLELVPRPLTLYIM